MKSIRNRVFTVCAVILCVGALLANAQSGRSNSGADAKSNRRSAAPTPLATPSHSDDQQTAAADDGGDVIKVVTQLVTIPVRVMDKNGKFVAGLTKENFKVFEDGVERELAMFSNEQQPFTVALVWT